MPYEKPDQYFDRLRKQLEQEKSFLLFEASELKLFLQERKKSWVEIHGQRITESELTWMVVICRQGLFARLNNEEVVRAGKIADLLKKARSS